MAYAWIRGLDANLITLNGNPIARAGVTITAGNLVPVSVAWINNQTVVSVIDDAGNSYLPLGPRFLMASGTYYQQSFYRVAVAGQTAQNMTVTFTGTVDSAYVMVNEYSFSSGKTVSFLQGAATASGAASPMDSGPISPSNPRGAAIMLYGFNIWPTAQPSQPSGWTNRDATWAFVGDLLNVDVGTYRYQPTDTGSQNWYAEIVAFIEVPLVASYAKFPKVRLRR